MKGCGHRLALATELSCCRAILALFGIDLSAGLGYTPALSKLHWQRDVATAKAIGKVLCQV